MPDYPFIGNIPAAGNNPSVDQPNMQTNTNSVELIVEVDLYGFNDANGGTHQQVTFPLASPTPAPTGTIGILYSALDSNGASQLWFKNKSTNIQLTNKSGSSPTGNASSPGNSGYTFLPGGMIIQWGTVLASTAGAPASFPISFPAQVFSIAGNIQAAGPQAFTIKSVNTSGATFQSSAGSQTMNYIAIGN